METKQKEVVQKPKQTENKQLVKVSDNKFVKVTDQPHTSTAVLRHFVVMSSIFVAILLISFASFTVSTAKEQFICKGVHIKGIDVSGLSKDAAREKISNYINENIPEEIKLYHNDYDASVSTDQLSISFNTDEAVDMAYNLGKDGNIFENDLAVFKAFCSPVNVDPGFAIDKEQLKTCLKDISTKLPDKLIESGYYIEGNSLVITKGSEGYVVDVDNSANYIISSVNDLIVKNNSLELVANKKSPKEIDLDAIHDEIYKSPVDASFTRDPYSVQPSETGIDFKISVDEAKALLEEEKEEYEVPLNVLYPRVTTNMLGMEAFPDLLSQYTINYRSYNGNRNTNLRLATEKVNGTVLMPGEEFSYNKTVGARTIAAGFKEASIYVNGRSEDGLGGGICQIASTLYNAVVYANLEITERSNHMFIPPYSSASRDATVAYGSIDFKFKNNRDYPIKIVGSINGSNSSFQIYGMRSDGDYEVEISAQVTGNTATAVYSQAYKTLKKNGAVVSTELLSKDVYKKH